MLGGLRVGDDSGRNLDVEVVRFDMIELVEGRLFKGQQFRVTVDSAGKALRHLCARDVAHLAIQPTSR